MRLLDEGGEDVGDGGEEAHGQAPVEGHRHDAVHDEDDEDEVPSTVVHHGAVHDAVHDEDEVPRHPEGVRDEGEGEVASLHGEQEPGAGRAPVQVVVGVAPAVAGQQAEQDVDGGGDGEVGDGGVAEAGTLQQQHREVGELHPEVDHVDENDALLALAVGVLLVSSLQPGVVQPAWHTALCNLAPTFNPQTFFAFVLQFKV